jgi:hypothetical protein
MVNQGLRDLQDCSDLKNKLIQKPMREGREGGKLISKLNTISLAVL